MNTLKGYIEEYDQEKRRMHLKKAAIYTAIKLVFIFGLAWFVHTNNNIPLLMCAIGYVISFGFAMSNAISYIFDLVVLRRLKIIQKNSNNGD